MTPKKTINILIVDDDPLLREKLSEYLSDDMNHDEYRFVVTKAMDYDSAVEALKAADNKFDLVLTDNSYPGGTQRYYKGGGTALVHYMDEYYPGVPVIMMTGDAGAIESIVAPHEHLKKIIIIKKPFKLSDIMTAIAKNVPIKRKTSIDIRHAPDQAAKCFAGCSPS